jgi:hypothetical protein
LILRGNEKLGFAEDLRTTLPRFSLRAPQRAKNPS